MALQAAHVTGLGVTAVECHVSENADLLLFDYNEQNRHFSRMAVRRDKYVTPYCKLYLDKEQRPATLTITSRMGGAWQGEYHLFTKNLWRALPNTCIESAEHVIKTSKVGRPDADRIEDSFPCRVKMSIEGVPGGDIDTEFMANIALKAFRLTKPNNYKTASKEELAHYPEIDAGEKRPLTKDAANEFYSAGDGMALVYSWGEMKRIMTKNVRYWSVHAVAVLLASAGGADPFLIVSEVFAPDDGTAPALTGDWDLSCYRDASDFKLFYSQVMPETKYSLWKLTGTLTENAMAVDR